MSAQADLVILSSVAPWSTKSIQAMLLLYHMHAADDGADSGGGELTPAVTCCLR